MAGGVEKCLNCGRNLLKYTFSLFSPYETAKKIYFKIHFIPQCCSVHLGTPHTHTHTRQGKIRTPVGRFMVFRASVPCCWERERKRERARALSRKSHSQRLRKEKQSNGEGEKEINGKSNIKSIRFPCCHNGKATQR